VARVLNTVILLYLQDRMTGLVVSVLASNAGSSDLTIVSELFKFSQPQSYFFSYFLKKVMLYIILKFLFEKNERYMLHGSYFSIKTNAISKLLFE